MVLAHFSPVRVIGLLLISGVILSPYVWLPLSNPDGLVAELTEQGVFSIAIFLGAIGSIVWVGYLAMFVRQVLFHRGAAIWIEDDCLIYANKRHKKIVLSDVRDVEVLRNSKYNMGNEVIALRMATGKTEPIPTGLISETAETVAARLRTKTNGSGVRSLDREV